MFAEPASPTEADGLPAVRLDACAVATLVDRLADLDLVELKLRSRSIKDIEGGVHDLRSDAIASSDGDGSAFVARHVYPSFLGSISRFWRLVSTAIDSCITKNS